MYKIEMNLMTGDNEDTPRHVSMRQRELMGDIFNDRQVVVMRDKKYLGSHIFDWVLMTIDVTSVGKGTGK